MMELPTMDNTPGNIGTKETKHFITITSNEPMIKCTPSQKRDLKTISWWCGGTLVIWLLTISFFVGLELIPRQNWNENAKTDLAEIVKHKVYIDTEGRRSSVMGFIYVNFPSGSKSKFEICENESGFTAKFTTEEQCQNYLDDYYAIGDEITIYYDPKNHSDVRLDKKSLDWSIAGIVIFFVIGIMCGGCCGYVSLNT